MIKKVIKGLLIVLTGFTAFTIGSCVSMELTTQVKPNLPSFGEPNSTLYKYNAIVRLHTEEGYFFCTGTVVDANYVMTAAHCVTDSVGRIDSKPIQIYDMYSNYTGTKAIAVAVDKTRDVAFIKGEFKYFNYEVVDFAGLNVHTGSKVRSCGFPAGQFNLYCVELVLKGNRYFQYRSEGLPLFKGMSGGAVFDMASGQVIGVNSAVDEDSIIISPVVGVLEQLGLR